MPGEREAEIRHGRRSAGDGGAPGADGECSARIARLSVRMVLSVAFDQGQWNGREEAPEIDYDRSRGTRMSQSASLSASCRSSQTLSMFMQK